MGFELAVLSSGGDVVRLGLSGRLEVGDTLDFHKACQPVIKDLGSSALQFDLERLSYIDSSGIGALVVMHNRARDEGWRMSLCNCNGDIMKVLRLLNLHRLFHIV